MPNKQILVALKFSYTMTLFILVITDLQSAWNPVISALLVHDQVTGAQQVIKNSLVRQRPVCGQVDIAQHDLLAGFERP